MIRAPEGIGPKALAAPPCHDTSRLTISSIRAVAETLAIVDGKVKNSTRSITIDTNL